MWVELTPRLYKSLIRPKWMTRFYIHNVITSHFDLRDKSVLDFGAGVGSNCEMFIPEQYTGLDYDAKRIQYARALYPAYRFFVSGENHLPVPNQSADIILIVAVLHHIPSHLLLRYLPEFHRVLKPGGMIIALEPYLCEKAIVCNKLMKLLDRGAYLRNEAGYMNVFTQCHFQTQVLKRFKKMLVYHELFFSAVPLL